MKRNAVWILVAIVAVLVVSSLVWNFSMQAAGPAGLKIKGRAAAQNTAKDNFDIRDTLSKDAITKFERRMQKISSKLKEKNSNMKQSMKGAKEKMKSKGVPGMEVTFSPLTNTPQLFEVRGKGHKFLTPASSQPRENIVRGFMSEYADLYGMSAQQVSQLRKGAADYTNPNGKLSWLKMEQRWNGMPVFQGEAMAAFTSSGEMARIVSGLTSGPDAQDLETTAKVSAADAVVAAAASIDVTLTAGELSV